MSEWKTCRRCLTPKRVSEFGPDSRRGDGLQSHCRDCRRKSANWLRYKDPQPGTFRGKRRHALKRGARPAWANRDMMVEFYREARRLTVETGVPHDVDHIVPLVSPRVQSLMCPDLTHKNMFFGPLIPVVQGLHAHTNMRVLPRAENTAKGNRHWPDMPDYQLEQWEGSPCE